MSNLGAGIYEDGFEDGFEDGYENGYKYGELTGQRNSTISLLHLALSRFGQVPSCVYETCEAVPDLNTLISWVSLAFQASSLEEFLTSIHQLHLLQKS